MARPRKRTITIGLLTSGATLTLIALLLAAQSAPAPAASPPPRVDPAPATLTTVPSPAPPLEGAASDRPAPPKPQPKVDLVFALDTTGSMGGLLAGAKRKIWSIANEVLQGQPRPHVRIGLIGYRDRGDEYVTRRHPLSEDMEDVYRQLQGFEAEGGGDTPEHVNRAVAEAIRAMQWRQGDHVLRLLFVVGDAPPHEGRGGLRSMTLGQEAQRKGIVINTVRCGTMGNTARAFKRMARAAGGLYASIRQDGAMAAIATPVDRRLAELNARLSRTLLPAGGRGSKVAARRRARINAGMDEAAQADSATYRALSGRLDSTDLLGQLATGRPLRSFKPGDLPAPVAKLPHAQRKAYVANVAREREKLRTEILRLSKKRDHFKRRARGKAAPMSFDDTVQRALEVQGAKAGIAY